MDIAKTCVLLSCTVVLLAAYSSTMTAPSAAKSSAAAMEAISWGKEKPKATRHDEAAWAENRGADLEYPKK